ncbi:MAG: hypothetical protein FJ399_23115 [Verrucomicrobia bacterium]|nr:hypothetical protein [Verrucomicrobiota bacterium]
MLGLLTLASSAAQSGSFRGAESGMPVDGTERRNVGNDQAPANTGSDTKARQKGTGAYPEPVAGYLARLFVQQAQPTAFRTDYPGGFRQWRIDAGLALRLRLGMDRIATSVGDHRPRVQLEESQDCGEYTLQRGAMETEPGIRIPFWLLQPKRAQPWPLGVFPHGHDRRGQDTTAGVYADADHAKKSLAEDRDVAVLAVNGRKDPLFSPAEIDRAVAQVRTIYASAGVPLHFQHRWGEEGHRFYRNLMWPFVLGAMQQPNSK